MWANIINHSMKCIAMIILVWIALTRALPQAVSDDQMVHNDNYDMVMPDGFDPGAAMQYQNFDEFFSADKMPNDAMAEMEMSESQISNVFVAPQPLTKREEDFRGHLEELDVQRERRVQRSLKKGSAVPRNNVNDWERFDYDMLLNQQQ